jgi:hypothetical protein
LTESDPWKGKALKSLANSEVAGLDLTDTDRDTGKWTGFPSRKCGIIRWGLLKDRALDGREGIVV